jgi:hypothetical protein
MSLGAILSAVGLAAALSLTTGHAEALAFDTAFAIDEVAMASDDPPLMDGFVETDVVDEAHGEEFEIQSDLDRGTLAVTVAPELSTWATTLFSLAGFGR